jgi:hypothetical protein
MPSITLSTGIVRAGHAIIRGTVAEAAAEDFDVVVFGPARRELTRVRLSDAQAPEAPAADAERSEFQAGIPLADLPAPILGVEVQPRSMTANVVTPSGYQLGSLFFETDEEFEASETGKRRAARPSDKETDCFFSRQMASHFEGERAHRILMSIAYCYRATELLDTGEMDRALGLLDECEQLLGGMAKHDRRFRLDRTHLHFSVLTARWHAELALGRLGSFEATMEKLAQDVPLSIMSDHCFPTSYNLVRGLLLLACHRGRQGRPEEGLALFDSAHKVLQCAAHSLQAGTLLAEFGSTCQLLGAAKSVQQALSHAAKGLANGEALAVLDKAMVSGIAKRCIRTSNSDELLACFLRAA